MGVNYNPRVVTNGLVLALDASNQFKSAKGFKNLLNLSTWTLGTGSVTGFSQNGLTTENQRILDTGPFGVSALVWDTPSNDAASDGDGGWDGSAISIDNTKMYRFSVWMRRRVIGNGSYYLGCAGGVLNRVDGVLNNNPYFSASSWPASILADQWMLIVGHIWPAGSGIGTNHVDSGLWNTSGTKFSGPTYNGDFIWQTSSTTTSLRSYLYYSTDTTTRQQWYQPRIDLVDGTQPTIAELISGVGSKWYDMVGSNHGMILNSAGPYNTNGYINFDGVDDYLTSSDLGNLTRFTCEAMVRIIVQPAGTKPCYITNVYPGTTGKVNFALGHVVSDSTIGLGIFDTAWNYSPTFTPQMNTWYHVVGSYDGAQIKLYINGVSQGTPTSYVGTPASSTGGIRIGRRWDLAEYFNGNISTVKVYNRALTEAEVSQNFDALRGRYGV